MVWVDIKGFEDKYQINEHGVIFNKKIRRVMKGNVDRITGYVKVNLYYNGQNNIFVVHRLVALTFIPNPDNLPQVHHIDGNKQNNSVENLEWVSSKTHGEKMTAEQKAKFRKSYQKFSKCH